MRKAQTEGLNIGYYLTMVSRRRWFIIVPFCLTVIVGMALVFKLPKIYEASTMILVEPQSVPEKYVSHRAHRHRRAHRLAGPADHEPQQPHGSDRALQALPRGGRGGRGPARGHAQAGQGEGGGAAGTSGCRLAFKVTYQDSDPEKVFQVVNAMATYVIDQNLKMRELHASGTSEFLQDELAKMRKRLEEVEAALENYRRAHMGELPEQLQSNLTILERLQQQLNEKNQGLRDEKNRLLIVDNQIRFAQQQGAPVSASGPAAPDPGLASLEALRRQLIDYEAKYTENHPDVVGLKKKIEKLEAEQAAPAPAASAAQAAPQPRPRRARSPPATGRSWRRSWPGSSRGCCATSRPSRPRSRACAARSSTTRSGSRRPPSASRSCSR